jgi:hypothetical protein
MPTQAPVSLSSEALDAILRLTAPIVPNCRVALMNELAQRLRFEPEQPPGDGAVYRHLQALLRSGRFKRNDSMVIGIEGEKPIRTPFLSSDDPGIAK